MARPKKETIDTASDDNATQRGDAILKRMLQSKPKPHKEVVAERKDKGRKSK
jgi:hypothetical protein